MKKNISPLIELLRGLTSRIPGFSAPIFTRTGGTNSARYCYSVWMRHLVLAQKSGALREIPKTAAELGPGDSLGMGLCALLSGAENYYAFDVVKYASHAKNLEIFEELINLFKNKSSIPDNKEFPLVKPYLDDYCFPEKILTGDLLKASLKKERLDIIRDSIKNPERFGGLIAYRVPWKDSSVIKKDSVDMIFSQATLEHVDDIATTYETMRDWLKPEGFMTHQIDFKCHGTARNWNGHWTHSDFWWKIIRGKRQWLLNRLPCSVHLNLARKNDFEIVLVKKVNSPSKIKRKSLNKKFQNISDGDLKTSGVFFVAVKTKLNEK